MNLTKEGDATDGEKDRIAPMETNAIENKQTIAPGGVLLEEKPQTWFANGVPVFPTLKQRYAHVFGYSF